MLKRTSVITRRALLKSTGVGIAGGAIMSPRHAWAPPPPPTDGKFAVNFPGSVLLRNAGSWASLPADSPDLFLSVIFNATGYPNSQGLLVTDTAGGSGSNTSIVIQISSNLRKNTAFLDVDLYDWRSNRELHAASSLGSIPYDGRWHILWVKANTQLGTISALIDKVAVNGFHTISWSGPFNVPLVTANYLGQTFRWTIGQRGTYYVGNMAEYYFYSAPVNIADPAIQGAFVDPSTNLPVRNPPSGSNLIVDGSGNLIKPQIYLYGGHTIFQNNPANYVWDWTSATDDQTHPNAFTQVGAGLLQTTTGADPWGFAGEA